LIALLLTCVGCATIEQIAKEVREKLPFLSKRTKPSYYIHEVRWPGETLSIIAKWYTGNMENWHHLAKANPHLDPYRIRIGTKIRIPPKSLHTQKPMPREFLAATEKRQKPSSVPPTKARTRTQPKPEDLKPTDYYHQVRAGETLWVIAKWYTGKGGNWRLLAEANPKLDPDRIIVGARIRIPKNLMHTQKPLPRAYVAAYKPAKKPKPASPALSTDVTPKKRSQPPKSTHPLEEAQQEPLGLFGPK
jgi:LysM repeat protein